MVKIQITKTLLLDEQHIKTESVRRQWHTKKKII